MKTKTIHRIPADKVVIEDDRREAQRDKAAIIEERKLPFTYSQKHKIIYVPVEPKSFEGAFHPMMNDVPFHPDDTLILMEKYVKDNFGKDYTLRDYSLEVGTVAHGKTVYHAALMPPSLDSKCQQFTVVKVLGVELKSLPESFDWWCPNCVKWISPDEVGPGAMTDDIHTDPICLGTVLEENPDESVPEKWHWKFLAEKATP